MRMKIELITPESGPSRRLRKWRLIRFPQLTMPLLAAYTPPRVELHHTDEIVEPVDLDRDADLVAITCNTPAAAHVYRLAGQLRARGRWQEIYRGRPADLRGMKAPRWDLIRGRRYGRAVTIATRGCVHRCGYCSIPFLYGRGQRRRPVAEVAREVALMSGKSVVFWDDYLMADRAYALALCRAIAPYRRWWTTQTTMRVAFDEELMAVAAESGCKAVFVGLETVSQRSLDLQGKRFNQVRLYERAVANLHRHGIAIQAGTMFGLDGDDSGIFERTLRFYRGIGIDSATVGIVVPMPGTPFFDEMVRRGRLLTMDWDRYNGKVDAVFRPSNMSARELEQVVAWFAEEFYSLPSIFDRLVCKSRVGIWWNLPRNLGYRLALHWRAAVRFDDGRVAET